MSELEVALIAPIDDVRFDPLVSALSNDSGYVFRRYGSVAQLLTVRLVEAESKISETESGVSETELTVSDNGSTELAMLILAVEAAESADEILRPILLREEYRHTRIVLLTEEEEISGVQWLADENRLDFLCYFPQLKIPEFQRNLSAELARYHAVKTGLGSVSARSERFLFDSELSDEEITAQIVAVIDEELGFQPRIRFPEGTRLTTEGRLVEEVTICLSGTVALERASEAGEVLMHHASTGRIIGLLALNQRRLAFFTARCTTEVVGIHLSFEQLNVVLQRRQEIEPLVAALFIRSLDRRLRRSEDIQIEKVELTQALETERANLALALRNLEAAREELMSQARFASLGELAAGVAHELNNPMAAVVRTSEHLTHDIHELIQTSKDHFWINQTTQALTAAISAQSVSTREARILRAKLTEITKDPALAQRLVLAGIYDEDFAREIAKSNLDNFATVELAASIGTGLRNLETAATRITELVASLRSYARPDGDPVTNVNINQTIDDTLRLLSHKLRGVKIQRDFAELPQIVGIPGELSQVWTNLITNAVEAITDAVSESAGKSPRPEVMGTGELGKITVTTSVRQDNGMSEPVVEVSIADDGPGIPPELQQRIFEPRFTTKGGQVRFGMGIGLGVCRSIVEKHNGRILVRSSSEGTVFTVVLPQSGPNASELQLLDENVRSVINSEIKSEIKEEQ